MTSLNCLVEIQREDGQLQKNRYDGERLHYEMEENDRLIRFLYHEEVVSEWEKEVGTTRYV